MIRIYCRNHHGGSPLCGDCSALSAYADDRLDNCPYGEGKPTCQNCPVHCYRKEKRDQIRQIMRYAGPRMIWRHPIMAVRHLIHNRRAPGELNRSKT